MTGDDKKRRRTGDHGHTPATRLFWTDGTAWPGDDEEAWLGLAATPGVRELPHSVLEQAVQSDTDPSLTGMLAWVVHVTATNGTVRAVRAWWPMGGADRLAIPPRAALAAAPRVPDGWDNLFPVLPQWAMRERVDERAGVRGFLDAAWVAARPVPGCHPAAFRQDAVGNVIAHPKACGYALAWLAFDVDHVHPWARGGLSCPPNLQALQAACNRSKGASDRARESADGPGGYASVGGGEGAAYASLRTVDELPDLQRVVASLPPGAARELRRLVGIPLDSLVPDAEETERLDRLGAEQQFEASELRRRVWALRDSGVSVDEGTTRRFALSLLLDGPPGRHAPAVASGTCTSALDALRQHFGATGGGATRRCLETLPDLEALVAQLVARA